MSGGFVFADFFRGEDDALGRGQSAQAGDEKFSGDDADDDPGGQEPAGDEADVNGADEDFVYEGVEKFSEVCVLVPSAGEVAVKPVGGGCDYENDERGEA